MQIKKLNTVVFTHNDLDGIMCGVLAKLYFPTVYINYCGCDTIDVTLQTFLENNIESLDKFAIIISDIGFKQENAPIANLLNKCGLVIIADHHKTTAWLNNIQFTNEHYMNVISDGDKCGASLLDEILENNFANCFSGSKEQYSKLKDILSWTNAWDIWQWSNQLKENDNIFEYILNNKSFLLNNAAYYYGTENFVTKTLLYLNGWLKLEDIFSDTFLEYCRKSIEQFNEFTLSHARYNSEAYGEIPFILIKLNTSNISLASILYKNYLKENDVQNQFMAIYYEEDKDAVSLRCNASGIDLSIIAKECEGGGHVEAAGCKRSKLLAKVNILNTQYMKKEEL